MRLLIYSLFMLCCCTITAQDFILNLGNPGVDDGPTCFKQYQNTLYISGYSSKKAYIAALDLEGNLLWKNYYSFSEQHNFITDFIIENNTLYLCGYGHNAGNDSFDEFFASIDLNNQKINWARKTSLELKPNNIHFYQGNLLISGDEYVKSKFGLCFIQLNPKNGKISLYKNWYFTGHESASISKIVENKIIAGGRYGIKPKTDKYRAGISVIKPSSFEQIEHHYFLNEKNETARAYLSDFCIEKDSIIASCYSNRTGIDNQYTLSVFKSDLQGNTAWAYEYALPGFISISSKDMLPLNHAYLILGHTKIPKEDLFLLKIDEEGYPIYAYTLGAEFADNMLVDQGSFMVQNQEHILVAAQSKNYNNRGDYDSFIFSFTEKELFSDTCLPFVKHTVIFKAYEELVEGTLVMASYDTTFKENNVPYETTNASTEINQFYCKRLKEDTAAISFENMAFNNTVFLLDASLSMNRADRLPVLKQAFYNLLQYLRAEDLVSVVEFSDKAKILLRGESAANKETIKVKIEESTSSGQSDIVSALQEGFKLANTFYDAGKNNRIIITTDGDLSFDTQNKLEDLLLKNKKENVFVSIFLFNHSTVYQEQLNALAQKTGASVYVIEPYNAQEILLNELSKRK